MTAMSLVPKRWYSWDFTVARDGRTIADLDLSAWREKGVIAVEGTEHRVFREGALSGDFVIEKQGQVLARATKPSAFRDTFVVTHNEKRYTLRKKSIWRRAFVLLDGDREIGSMAPDSPWTRQATINLPPDWPLPITSFVIWLAIILWKRDSDSAAAGAA